MTATPRHVIFGTGAIGLAALDALRRRGETVRLIKPVRLRPRPAPPLIASCLFSAIGGSLRCGDSVDTDPIPPARVSATAVKHAAVPEMATKVVVRKPSANSSQVLALTGMRRGEVCALRWSDVDLDRGVLTVRRQLVEVNGRAVEGRPKTRSGEDRRVDIGERTIAALLGHRLRQDLERRDWGSGYAGTNRVFTREDGTDLIPSYVTKLFNRLVAQADLRPVRLHDLRHGAASLMIAGGVDVAVISKRLGHSSIRITADVYGHLLPGAGRQAADVTEALLRPPATT